MEEVTTEAIPCMPWEGKKGQVWDCGRESIAGLACLGGQARSDEELYRRFSNSKKWESSWLGR